MAGEVAGSRTYVNDFLAGLDVEEVRVELVEPRF